MLIDIFSMFIEYRRTDENCDTFMFTYFYQIKGHKPGVLGVIDWK